MYEGGELGVGKKFLHWDAGHGSGDGEALSVKAVSLEHVGPQEQAQECGLVRKFIDLEPFLSLQPDAARENDGGRASKATWLRPAVGSVSPVSKHFGECVVCLDRKLLASGAFGAFCFQEFRVTGDRTTVDRPRHPGTVCHGCLRSHCESAIGSGKLFVKCPALGCGRSLQTLELRSLVGAKAYVKLVARLKEAEDAVVEPGDLPAGLELRMCPQCNVRIEKNQVRLFQLLFLRRGCAHIIHLYFTRVRFSAGL